LRKVDQNDFFCCFPLGLLKSAFNGVAVGKHSTFEKSGAKQLWALFQSLPKAPLEGKVEPKKWWKL
jgi:hypothetical protein